VLLRRALTDKDQGLGAMSVEAAEEALNHFARMASGDARRALSALEIAVLSTEPDAQGIIRLDLATAQECMPRRDLIYDKQGDAHYDTVSAFIKSVRGSDPDAALYWLARMLEAGEDPRFIMRRLLILASEDIGLADPNALVQVAAASQALTWVGLPEGQYHLAQATLYLALAPKSNSTAAYFRAQAALEQKGATKVPTPLQDAHRDRKGLGHGEGYLYPHDFPGHWVEQEYLPEELAGERFYESGSEGKEPELAARWRAFRRKGKEPPGGSEPGAE
jgi:putative ATPase